MSPSRIPAADKTNPLSSEQAKPGFRTKTIATRITSEELREIETAAEHTGKSLAEWLRDIALKTARQRSVDPMELLLAEQMATRYALLNFFHATALAASEGKQLLPETVLKIRDTADAQKLQKARKLLEDFFAQEGQTGGTP